MYMYINGYVCVYMYINGVYMYINGYVCVYMYINGLRMCTCLTSSELYSKSAYVGGGGEGEGMVWISPLSP